jgi:hypothetical protein
MSQQKRFTLRRLEPAQRVLYLVMQRLIACRMIRRCGVHVRIVVNHSPLAFGASCRKRPAFIHYYLIQPGSKPVRIATLGKIPKRANERELKRVVSVLQTSEHVRREAGIRVAVPANENAISVRVAGEHCRYDARVGPVGQISIAHVQ